MQHSIGLLQDVGVGHGEGERGYCVGQGRQPPCVNHKTSKPWPQSGSPGMGHAGQSSFGELMRQWQAEGPEPDSLCSSIQSLVLKGPAAESEVGMRSALMEEDDSGREEEEREEKVEAVQPASAWPSCSPWPAAAMCPSTAPHHHHYSHHQQLLPTSSACTHAAAFPCMPAPVFPAGPQAAGPLQGPAPGAAGSSLAAPGGPVSTLASFLDITGLRKRLLQQSSCSFLECPPVGSTSSNMSSSKASSTATEAASPEHRHASAGEGHVWGRHAPALAHPLARAASMCFGPSSIRCAGGLLLMGHSSFLGGGSALSLQGAASASTPLPPLAPSGPCYAAPVSGGAAPSSPPPASFPGARVDAGLMHTDEEPAACPAQLHGALAAAAGVAPEEERTPSPPPSPLPAGSGAVAPPRLGRLYFIPGHILW